MEVVSRVVEAQFLREVVIAVVEFLIDAVAETLSDAAVDSLSGEVVLRVAMAGAAHVAPYGKPQVTLASNSQLSSPKPPSASRAVAYVPGDSRPYHGAQQPACRVGPTIL